MFLFFVLTEWGRCPVETVKNFIALYKRGMNNNRTNRSNRSNRTNRANNAPIGEWTIVSPPGKGKGGVRNASVPIYPSRPLDGATRTDVIRFLRRGATNETRRVIRTLDVLLLRPNRVFNQNGGNRWETKIMTFDTRVTGNRTPQYQLLNNEQRREVVDFLYPKLQTSDVNANILIGVHGTKLICLPECCSFHLMPYVIYPVQHMTLPRATTIGKTAQEIVDLFGLINRPPKSFKISLLTDREIADPRLRMRCTAKIPAKMKAEMFPGAAFASDTILYPAI